MMLPASSVAIEIIPPLHDRGAPPQIKGVRVLLVEDHKATRESFAKLLALHEVEIRSVESTSQAREILKHWRPSLLISDIGMPGEDGHSFIRSIRAEEPEDEPGLPAIALTAHVSQEDRHSALTNGFDRYLAKPVEPDLLIHTIRNLLFDR